MGWLTDDHAAPSFLFLGERWLTSNSAACRLRTELTHTIIKICANCLPIAACTTLSMRFQTKRTLLFYSAMPPSRSGLARETTCHHWPLLPRLAYCTAYLRLNVLPGIIMVTPKADHAYTEHKGDKLNLPRINTRRCMQMIQLTESIRHFCVIFLLGQSACL